MKVLLLAFGWSAFVVWVPWVLNVGLTVWGMFNKKEADKARGIADVVIDAIEKLPASASPKAVKDAVKVEAIKTGAEFDLHALLIEKGYSRGKPVA